MENQNQKETYTQNHKDTIEMFSEQSERRIGRLDTLVHIEDKKNTGNHRITPA